MEQGELIQKADGSFEGFDEEKLRDSLSMTEATPKDIDQVVAKIKDELRPNVRTEDIYQRAHGLLKQQNKSYAARYSLRRALAQLGPTGFPFEQFLSHIYEHQGYSTEVGVMLKGKCVEHEIDVVATKDTDLKIVEAKFHNQASIKSDLKTALYVSARYDDLRQTKYDGKLKEGMSHSCLLMTNTKFTRNAIRYGECAGIELIGWSYPKKGNLQELIQKESLHPITTLSSLSNGHKQELAQKGVVLCKSLRENKESMQELGLSDNEIEGVIEEVNNLCHL